MKSPKRQTDDIDSLDDTEIFIKIMKLLNATRAALMDCFLFSYVRYQKGEICANREIVPSLLENAIHFYQKVLKHVLTIESNEGFSFILGKKLDFFCQAAFALTIFYGSRVNHVMSQKQYIPEDNDKLN